MENKLIQVITGKGIRILDDELMEKVKSKSLSPSMIGGIDHCPADWFFSTYILPMIEHEEKIYFARGTMFHSVMEKFFALPGEERTKAIMGKICKEVIEKEFPRFIADGESKEWLSNAIKNYFEMDQTFQHEKIATVLNNGKEESGIECFVSGQIGKAKRKTLGFVDRVTEGPNGLKVSDWKTGKKISPFSIDKPINKNNSFDYWRQQLIYTILLEQEGNKVAEAELIFPVAKGVVSVDIFSEKARNQVIEDVERVDAALDKYIEENLFPFKNALFCGFCSNYNALYRGKRWVIEANKRQLESLIEFVDPIPEY